MAGAPLDAAAKPDPSVAERSLHTRAVLHGDDAWLVASGYADVFAAVLVEGTGGRRHHLFRAQSGALLFGLPASTTLIVEAVGTGATVLRPIRRHVLDARIRDAGDRPDLLRSIERWVDQMTDYVAVDVPPRGCVRHAAGADVSVPSGSCVRPAAGVIALQLLTGSVEALGSDPPLTAGDVIALSWRGWVRAREDSSLRLMEFGPIAERGEAWRALATFQCAALGGVARRLDAIAEAEGVRYATRATATVTANASALGALAATFHGVSLDRLAPPPAASELGQLNAACQLVTSHLGVPFVRPTATSATIKEGIENVARAAKIRARHITLENAWWHHEQGPLVGFLKLDNRAVALLPRRRGGYALVDPADGASRRIDTVVAATLSPTAVIFYRPFGQAAVDSLALLRFSAHGCGRDLGMVLLGGALAGVIGMGVPIATGVLINSIIPSTDRTQLVQWTMMLVVCAVATAMFQMARSIALIRLEMKLGYAVQAAVWDRLISLPARFFREYSAGNLATRAMGIDAVRQVLSGATIRGILGGMFSVFNFALMFYYDVPLAIGGTIVIGVAVTVLVTVAYLQRIQQRESVSLNAKKSGLLLQLLTGIRKLRVAGAEMRAFGTWTRLFGEQRRAKARIAFLGNIWKVFAVTIPLVALAVLISVIVATSSDGSIPTGNFLAFMAAFSGCMNAILTTASAAIGALSIVPHYELARPILQALPEISAGQADPGMLSGEIAVDRVSFGYRPDSPPVLNDLTFAVKPGEFVAFVGPSGSGKSTILRLLLGFETPQSGAVSYDSRDLKELDLRAVRRQIGAVLQSGRLVPGDIHTNIVGCSAASMQDAWAASRMAGFEEDLKRMPMGMHTMVTDGGGTLSGGQRQRLMIARAIVTSPRMLFFDEATSALDNQTQAIVSRSLEQLRATRVVIAHRLSTIINADRIFVVDKGRIVQSGRYDELMAHSGPFQELARRQLA